MTGLLRRSLAVAAAFVLVGLCFVASAAASTDRGGMAPTGPDGVLAPTTRIVMAPGMRAAAPLLPASGIKAAASPLRAYRSKSAKLGTKLGISSPASAKVMSLVPNHAEVAAKPNAFLGYVYYSWGFAAVYDGVFNYAGLTWYYQTFYFYDYAVNYLGYGSHFWYYYFGWNYYGWVCCGY